MDTLWPKTSGLLFIEGGFGAQAAHLLADDIGLIAIGYKDAADALIRSLAETGRNDAIAYPIVYCYRQYLELQIKTALMLVHKFEETGEDVERIHNLEKLWFSLKAHVKSEIDERDAEAFAAVENCVLQFHQFDPHGTSFRYPEIALSRQIDLGNLKAVMNRIGAFLESLCDYWENGIDNKS